MSAQIKMVWDKNELRGDSMKSSGRHYPDGPADKSVFVGGPWVYRMPVLGTKAKTVRPGHCPNIGSKRCKDGVKVENSET